MITADEARRIIEALNEADDNNNEKQDAIIRIVEQISRALSVQAVHYSHDANIVIDEWDAPLIADDTVREAIRLQLIGHGFECMTSIVREKPFAVRFIVRW